MIINNTTNTNEIGDLNEQHTPKHSVNNRIPAIPYLSHFDGGKDPKSFSERASAIAQCIRNGEVSFSRMKKRIPGFHRWTYSVGKRAAKKIAGDRANYYVTNREYEKNRSQHEMLYLNATVVTDDNERRIESHCINLSTLSPEERAATLKRFELEEMITFCEKGETKAIVNPYPQDHKGPVDLKTLGIDKVINPVNQTAYRPVIAKGQLRQGKTKVRALYAVIDPKQLSNTVSEDGDINIQNLAIKQEAFAEAGKHLGLANLARFRDWPINPFHMGKDQFRDMRAATENGDINMSRNAMLAGNTIAGFGWGMLATLGQSTSGQAIFSSTGGSAATMGAALSKFSNIKFLDDMRRDMNNGEVSALTYDTLAAQNFRMRLASGLSVALSIPAISLLVLGLSASFVPAIATIASPALLLVSGQVLMSISAFSHAAAHALVKLSCSFGAAYRNGYQRTKHAKLLEKAQSAIAAYQKNRGTDNKVTDSLPAEFITKLNKKFGAEVVKDAQHFNTLATKLSDPNFLTSQAGQEINQKLDLLIDVLIDAKKLGGSRKKIDAIPSRFSDTKMNELELGVLSLKKYAAPNAILKIFQSIPEFKEIASIRPTSLLSLGKNSDNYAEGIFDDGWRKIVSKFCDQAVPSIDTSNPHDRMAVKRQLLGAMFQHPDLHQPIQDALSAKQMSLKAGDATLIQTYKNSQFYRKVRDSKQSIKHKTLIPFVDFGIYPKYKLHSYNIIINHLIKSKIIKEGIDQSASQQALDDAYNLALDINKTIKDKSDFLSNQYDQQVASRLHDFVIQHVDQKYHTEQVDHAVNVDSNTLVDQYLGRTTGDITLDESYLGTDKLDPNAVQAMLPDNMDDVCTAALAGFAGCRNIDINSKDIASYKKMLQKAEGKPSNALAALSSITYMEQVKDLNTSNQAATYLYSSLSKVFNNENAKIHASVFDTVHEFSRHTRPTRATVDQFRAALAKTLASSVARNDKAIRENIGNLLTNNTVNSNRSFFNKCIELYKEHPNNPAELSRRVIAHAITDPGNSTLLFSSPDKAYFEPLLDVVRQETHPDYVTKAYHLTVNAPTKAQGVRDTRDLIEDILLQSGYISKKSDETSNKSEWSKKTKTLHQWLNKKFTNYGANLRIVERRHLDRRLAIIAKTHPNFVEGKDGPLVYSSNQDNTAPFKSWDSLISPTLAGMHHYSDIQSKHVSKDTLLNKSQNKITEPSASPVILDEKEFVSTTVTQALMQSLGTVNNTVANPKAFKERLMLTITESLSFDKTKQSRIHDALSKIDTHEREEAFYRECKAIEQEIKYGRCDSEKACQAVLDLIHSSSSLVKTKPEPSNKLGNTPGFVNILQTIALGRSERSSTAHAIVPQAPTDSDWRSSSKAQNKTIVRSEKYHRNDHKLKGIQQVNVSWSPSHKSDSQRAPETQKQVVGRGRR